MLSAQTRLVLVNAVYFKGDWLTKFDPANTVPGTFHAPDGPRDVQLMQTKQPFAVGRLPSLKSRVLLLPYKVGWAAGGGVFCRYQNIAVMFNAFLDFDEADKNSVRKQSQ